MLFHRALIFIALSFIAITNVYSEWASTEPPPYVTETTETLQPPVAPSLSVSVKIDDIEKSDNAVTAANPPLPPKPNAGVAGDILLSPNADVWQRIRIGFAMPELNSRLIQQHEDWYMKRPDYVKRMLERSQRYLFYVVEEVEKRGMPTEIALLPMIESAYNPKAYSTSHASGIWQFVPATGKDFGLKQNWWYDSRRDIVAATNSALDYLEKLHGMFGSWDLALAAYNWGEGSVSRAINRNLAAGQPTDYLSLQMPNETRNYVPKLMAIKNIIMEPARYGINLNTISNQPYFATVQTHKPMDIVVAARLAEIPIEEFVALNPAHNRPFIAADKGINRLLLPIDKVSTFKENLAKYTKPLVSWGTYDARRGEKLSKIARAYNISVQKLKELNALVGNKIKAAQLLLVPHKGEKETTLADTPPAQTQAVARNTKTEQKNKLTHTVKKTETLFSIAKQYGVTTTDIKLWNKLKGTQVKSGQRLVVYANTKLANKSVKKYVVRRGDTVKSIAKRFNVDVADIQRWNDNLSLKRTLIPGSVVVLSDSEQS